MQYGLCVNSVGRKNLKKFDLSTNVHSMKVNVDVFFIVKFMAKFYATVPNGTLKSASDMNCSM